MNTTNTDAKNARFLALDTQGQLRAARGLGRFYARTMGRKATLATLVRHAVAEIPAIVGWEEAVVAGAKDERNGR